MGKEYKKKFKDTLDDILVESFSNTLLNMEEISVKCRTYPPHISSLPYDYRTTDPVKLGERRLEVQTRISMEQERLKEVEEKDSALRQERVEYEDLKAELKEASEYLGVLNSRYATNYRKKFEQAYNEYANNDNFYNTLKGRVSSVDVNGDLTPDELEARINSNLNILYGNIFNNSFLLTPKQMETFNQLISDMDNFTSMTYTPNDEMIPYVEELFDRRVNACKRAVKTMEELTVIPKEYTRAEENIYNLTDKVTQQTPRIDEVRGEIEANVKEGKAINDRLKDYENELDKLDSIIGT